MLIVDSHGNPTVEVDFYTDKDLFRTAVPSNASTGIYEELGDTSCFAGKTSKFHWISKWKLENTSKQ
uniref:Enolase N-terminal domain-containing protein n=1 Tax=Sparus aurata TaxID=8175 RepID=A0A671TZK0_SPAAU